MSDLIELAFRHELVTAFAADLGTRVFDVASPPDQVYPLATYRRVTGATNGSGDYRQARLQLTLREPSYTAVKRLQQRVEGHFGGLVRSWMGDVVTGCPVWVHSADVVTLQDVYQTTTRLRLATSEFTFRYAEVIPA